MAKETFAIKVEGQTKETMNELIDAYMERKMIVEKGDIINVATFLLERNLAVKNPKITAAIDELDQLTARINRLFLHLFEQNQTAIEDTTYHLKAELKQARDRIDEEQLEKEVLEKQLSAQKQEVSELRQMLDSRDAEQEKLETQIDEKNRYIRILETNQETAEKRILELEQFEKQNKEFLLERKDFIHNMDDLQAEVQRQIDAMAALSKTHQEEQAALQFAHEKALFARERELNQRFQEEAAAIREQRDHAYLAQEKRLETIQDKHDALVAEKQALEDSNRRMLEEKHHLEKENQRLNSIVKKL